LPERPKQKTKALDDGVAGFRPLSKRRKHRSPDAQQTPRASQTPRAPCLQTPRAPSETAVPLSSDYVVGGSPSVNDIFARIGNDIIADDGKCSALSHLLRNADDEHGCAHSCSPRSPNVPRGLQSREFVIHRIVIREAKDFGKPLPVYGRNSLQSFAACGGRQMLWSNDPTLPLLGNVFVLCHTAHFLSDQLLNRWISSNVPMQIVKDILSLMILYHLGGAFADMKVFWGGKRS
jgi:hypothetical protein